MGGTVEATDFEVANDASLLILFEDFYVYVHQREWPVFCFAVVFDVIVCIQLCVNAGLIR